MKTPFTRLLIAAAFLVPGMAGAAEEPVRLDFVIAHKPDNAENMRLIEDFAKRVKERTKGSVEIVPAALNPTEEERHANSHEVALGKVYTGEAAMSQISVKKVSEVAPDLEVLDIPLMFRTHEQAAKVLDGDVGARLRESVHTASSGSLRGLAFTYSGGFRDIYSTKGIGSVSDLKGMKMRIRSASSARDAMAFLGVSFFSFPPGNDITPSWVRRHGDADGLTEEAELNRIITYKRYQPEMIGRIKTVLETRHSLYLTLVTIHGPTFDKLSKDQQEVLQKEAERLAKEERELSIRQEKTAKAELEKAGVKFVRMSKADQAQLDEMAAKVRTKYQSELGTWFAAIDAATGVRTNVAGH
jgi:TRAP-type C4-dicarboxylate transport system substrate-binding protein